MKGRRLPTVALIAVLLATSSLRISHAEAAGLPAVSQHAGTILAAATNSNGWDAWTSWLARILYPVSAPAVPAIITHETSPPSTTTVVNKTVYQYLPASTSPAITVSPMSGVSEAELTQKLLALQTSLQGQITERPIGYSDNAPTRNYGLTFKNLTVNGVTGLTDADIPDSITASNYLPLSGGTVSGNLTVTGAFSGSALTLANTSTTLLSVAGPAYFGATATSTFGTDGSLTLAHALGVGSGGTGWTNINAGSILFGNGSSALATSSALFWDNTNSRLGIGTTSLGATLSVQGNGYFSGTGFFGGALTSTSTLTVSGLSALNGGVGINGDTTLAGHLLVNGASTASAAALVNVTGNVSYNFILGNISQGSLYRSGAATINNTGAGGTIAGAFAVNSFNQATLTSDNPSTYTDAATLYIGDRAAIGSNVTLTGAAYGFYSANGKAGIFSTKGASSALCSTFPSDNGICDGGLLISGAQIIPAWGITGPMLAIGTGTLLDTTSSGTVTSAVGSSFNPPIFAANSATTYTTAVNLFVNGDPTAGTNATLTNAWALRVLGHTNLQSLQISGNLSAPHWLINQGIAYNSMAATYTDTSSSGTISGTSATSFNAPTFAASSATTYTSAATVYIANAPTAGSNVTITHGLALDVNAGTAYFGGNVGIATTSPWRTFSVTGTVALSGLTADTADQKALCLTAGGEVVANTGSSCITSSQRFKNNIQPLDSTSGLAEIMALSPVSFAYKPEIGIPGTQVGFIAEQMQQIDPRLVVLDASGTPFTVRYENLTAILAKAIQEIAAISGVFRDNLVAWLGDASNGIDQFFATVGTFHTVNTTELCIADSAGKTCVTRSQLDALLAGQGLQATAEQGSAAPPSDAPSTVASSTPDQPPATTPPITWTDTSTAPAATSTEPAPSFDTVDL